MESISKGKRLSASNGKHAPVEQSQAQAAPTDVRISMSWMDDGTKRRLSGLEASALAQALNIEPATLQAAIGELITNHPQGTGTRGERTKEQREKERQYREQRKASMTPEQVEAERQKRKEYNAKKNAEIKAALALLREQQNGK